MNNGTVYWDWDSMQNDGHQPAILAIGDSWFWYPLPGGSLITQLARVLKPDYSWVLAVGNNGAEAFDYAAGKYAKAVRSALSLHGSSVSAVFISGGGNDFAGFNDLRPLLKSDCSQAQSPEDCFRPGMEDRTLAWLLKKTSESYRALIGQILVSTSPATPVFVHNYDYAYPSGKGVFGKNSSWLKPALDDAKVPDKLQRGCVKTLIDQHTLMLKELLSLNANRIVFVDSTNTLAETDWANELHPKSKGFKKIAVEKWRPILMSRGLA